MSCAKDPGLLFDAELKLRAAIFGPTTDQQTIDSLKTRINEVRTVELDHRVEMMTKVAEILTPEQRQELLKLESKAPRVARGGM